MDIVRPKLLRKMVGEDEKLTSKSKVDLIRLPPCHRVALYKRADQAILQKPKPYDDEHGWEKTQKECWNRCSPVLPMSLVDILHTIDHEEEEFEFDSFIDHAESDDE